MQILENKALHIKVKNPAHVTAVIPKSKQIGPHEVVVHWGLEEAQVLRNLGVKRVPSPILRDYKWPGKFVPYAHQKTTAEFFTLNKRAFCFSQPGTGKTSSAIWAADYLMTKGVIRRALIICPLSIMDCAWRGDFFSTVMHRKVNIAHGSTKRRKEVINSDAEFVIINFDGVEIVLDDIMVGGFDLIIVDECSAYQQATTKRWKALNKILTPEKWLWMMTGTPAAQSPAHAYGLAKLVNPAKTPRFFGAFRDMVMLKLSQFKYVPRHNASEIVHELLQPAIRFAKEDCLDLPPMTYVKRYVEMSAQQKKYYDTLRKRMVMEAAGETVTTANAAVNLNKLLQLSAGCTYTDTSETLHFDVTPRYNVLREVLDETPRKVIIFAAYQHVIDMLVQRLNKDGIATDSIHGGVSAGKRTELFSRFQNADDPRVLVIQPQAAAHGVTLTAADTIVWWGPVPSLETFVQANARIDRPGQKFNTTVVQLYSSPAEQHIYQLLNDRTDVHAKLIDLYGKILA